MIYTEIKLTVEKELYILMFTIISPKLQQKDTFEIAMWKSEIVLLKTMQPLY